MDYDFCGWATVNDVKCADGLTIRKGAFSSNNGKKVPLVWGHKHDDPTAVIGHAILEERDKGMYAYCKFNDTPNGKHSKEMVKNGDVNAMSIWANNLNRVGNDVMHGNIREVSLVLAGANPKAFIESVVEHGIPIDELDDEGIIYTAEPLVLEHADDGKKDEPKDEPKTEDGKGTSKGSGKTVGEVLSTLNEEQKRAVAIVVGQAIQDARDGEESEEDDEEDDENMKHNIFEGTNNVDETGDIQYLSHDDMKEMIAEAKRVGSMKEVVRQRFGTTKVLMHTDPTLNNGAKTPLTGMTTATGTQTYGFNDPSMLFPDYRALSSTPEWLSRNMDWVNVLMGAVGHTPFSRIKSVFANITEDEARARGYIKGKQKKTEVFSTLKRTTDPQTVYKLQKMNRDDIIDITDFDVVAWIKAEMRVMLNEEIARAILIGDGRLADAEDKIDPVHIRPIATDVPLFNTKVEVDLTSVEDTKEAITEAKIDAILRGRKNYKGSGNPIYFTTEDELSEMLLLKDGIGHRMYKTEAELATALRVSKIVTVEVMEGQKIDNAPLYGIMVNPADYKVGADKGGAIALFDDFDLDFNKYTYLIETRISGALVKPFSAVTFVGKALA